MKFTGEGAYAGNTYIPSADEAAAIEAMTGRQVIHMARPIDEEFSGIGGDDRSIISRLEIEFGGARDKLREYGNTALGGRQQYHDIW